MVNFHTYFNHEKTSRFKQKAIGLPLSLISVFLSDVHVSVHAFIYFDGFISVTICVQ